MRMTLLYHRVRSRRVLARFAQTVRRRPGAYAKQEVANDDILRIPTHSIRCLAHARRRHSGADVAAAASAVPISVTTLLPHPASRAVPLRRGPSLRRPRWTLVGRAPVRGENG